MKRQSTLCRRWSNDSSASAASDVTSAQWSRLYTASGTETVRTVYMKRLSRRKSWCSEQWCSSLCQTYTKVALSTCLILIDVCGLDVKYKQMSARLAWARPHTLVVWRGNFAGKFHWFKKLWQGCVTEKCRKWLWYDLSRDHSVVWFCKFLLLTHSCQYNIMSASLHSSVPLNICLIPWFQFMQKTTIMD